MEVTNLLTELKTRWKKPTPPFFQKLGHIGLILAGVGGAILTAPVSVPAALTTAAGYLLTAGVIITSISQVTVDSPLDSSES
jgi:ABC-type xylose transport system permease subunit